MEAYTCLIGFVSDLPQTLDSEVPVWPIWDCRIPRWLTYKNYVIELRIYSLISSEEDCSSLTKVYQTVIQQFIDSLNLDFTGLISAIVEVRVLKIVKTSSLVSFSKTIFTFFVPDTLAVANVRIMESATKGQTIYYLKIVKDTVQIRSPARFLDVIIPGNSSVPIVDRVPLN